MRNLNESAKALRELLGQRILVLDGAMGTMLQQRDLTELRSKDAMRIWCERGRM